MKAYISLRSILSGRKHPKSVLGTQSPRINSLQSLTRLPNQHFVKPLVLPTQCRSGTSSTDGTFEDDASKSALTADITAFYTDRVGLPAFYVVVNFIRMAGKNSIWVGGKKVTKENPFVRIAIEHIAVHADNNETANKRTADGIDRVLKPHIADKGYDWEFHVDETEKHLWKIQGLHAPPFKSEAEKGWVKQNKATPWENKL